jgi:peptidoglycan/xylan/chitin deacetylase (PgdA/CDA1 family)
MPGWPGGARGALCLSFDNLGEAAEIELGAIAPDDPAIGTHPTVNGALRSVRLELMLRGIKATFFVEGLNAELYPQQLVLTQMEGQELGYHAWRHEQWDGLSAIEQTGNLERGLAAFGEMTRFIGRPFTGMRPPGGQLGAGGLDVIRRAGLRYCSPAGEGPGFEDGIVLLPFQWQHVDVACVLPPMAPVRERIAGSPDPIEPDDFLAHLEREIRRLEADGGFFVIVLHLAMLDWLGKGRLMILLSRLRQAREEGGIWITSCEEVASHVLANPGEFEGSTTLDPTSWSG